MSGYNQTQVRLERLARAINEASTARRSVSEAGKAAATTAAQLAADVAAMAADTPEAAAAYRDIATRLGELSREAARIGTSADTIEVPGRPADTSDAAVASINAGLRASSAQIAALAAKSGEVARETGRVSEADAAVAELRAEIARSDGALQGRLRELSHWVPERASRLSHEMDALRSEARSLADAPSAERLIEVTVSLMQREHSLDEAIVAAIDEVDALRTRHDQRLYTLKGLRHVCSQLGFDETDGPRYEGGPQSVIVLRVDTRVRGTITFRLGLDGRIETDSTIDPRQCPAEFGRLSEALVQEYGVQTQFEHMDADAKPKRRSAGEADLPTGKSAAQSVGGS